MATTLEQAIYQLLGGGTDSELEKTIAAENPYLQAQAVPQSLSSLAQQLSQPTMDKTGRILAPYSVNDEGKAVTYKPSSSLPWVAGGSFLSGLLQGVGNDYSNTLRQRATESLATGNSSNLPSNLFGQVQRSRSLFGALRDVQKQGLEDEIDSKSRLMDLELEQKRTLQREASNDALKQEVVKGLLKNPRRAQQSVDILRQFSDVLGGGKSAPVGIDAKAAEIPAAGESLMERDLPLGPSAEQSAPEVAAAPSSTYGVKGLRERRAELVRYYEDNTNMEDADIAQAVKQDLAGELAANQKGFAKVDLARSKANEILAVANGTDAALDQGLETGFGAGVGQTLAEIGSVVGVGTERASAGQLLEAQKTKAIAMNRVPGVGAMSDPEMRLYIQGGPSLNKTPEANREIARRIRQVAERDKDYADFADIIREQGGTIQDVDRLWSKYERANPFFTYQKGKVVPNTKIQHYTEFDFANAKAKGPDNDKKEAAPSAGASGSWGDEPSGSGGAPGGNNSVDDALSSTGRVIKSFGRGVLETPQAIASLFKPSTYKEEFGTPMKALDTVGRGTAMALGAKGGAVTGGGIGALFGPLAPVTAPIGAVVGAGVGAGAGYLGYNKLKEGASELAGVGTEETVIPTITDMEDAARVAGQGAGIGALGKGVGTGVRAVKGVTKGVSKGLDSVVEATKKDTIGVRPADIEKMLDEGKLKYFDDAGNEVATADATQFKSKLDQSLQVIDKDGFFDAVKNNPDQTKLVLDQRIKARAKDIGDLHAQADNALVQIHKSLSPIQQKQFPLTRNPSTGKGGFQPDFKSVFDTINEITVANPQAARMLKQRANAVIDHWNKSSRSYNTLQQRKQIFGAAGKWKGVASEKGALWGVVQEKFNRVFADTQAKAFDFAMGKVAPDKVGALAEANAKFAAYKTVEPLVNKSAAKGKPPLFTMDKGVIGNAASLPRQAVRRSPGTVRQGAEGLNSVLAPMSRGLESASSALDSGISAALPYAESVPPALNTEPRFFSPRGSSAVTPDIESLVQKTALDVGVDPGLARALVMQESSGNPNAVSPAGAVGLTQLMPKTAEEVAGKLALKEYNLRDAATNLKMGLSYYKSLLDQLGDERLALAAYNGGIGRVSRLLSSGGSTFEDIVPGLQELGLQETIDYVPAVLKRKA